MIPKKRLGGHGMVYRDEKIIRIFTGCMDRRAGLEDLAAVQAQLAQVANDPNLTMVTTHHWPMCTICGQLDCVHLSMTGAS